MSKSKVTGLERISQELHDKVHDIKDANIRGFIKSIVLIQGEMEKSMPAVPLDLGNLRASFFSVTAKGVGRKIGGFSGDSEDVAELEQDHIEAINEGISDVIHNKGMVAVLGFSANYSWWVHENVGGGVKWSKAGTGPRFFSTALENNQEKILEIIKNEIAESL